MKKLILSLLVFLCLTVAVVLAFTEKLTVKDWAKITHQRKIYFVLGSMEAFEEKGIVFTHTMDDYILWMDKETSKKANAENMDKVFADLVSANEAPPIPASTSSY